MQNTILARNTDLGGEAPNCSQSSGAAFMSGDHNLFGTLKGCVVALPLSDHDVFPVSHPHLAALADNGGFTQTVALKKGSAAINHGSPAHPGSGGGACVRLDQRGVKRPQGPRCDIGAYERKHRRHHR